MLGNDHSHTSLITAFILMNHVVFGVDAVATVLLLNDTLGLVALI